MLELAGHVFLSCVADCIVVKVAAMAARFLRACETLGMQHDDLVIASVSRRAPVRGGRLPFNDAGLALIKLDEPRFQSRSHISDETTPLRRDGRASRRPHP